MSLKLAVLSHILPPSSSGQAMILYKLFNNWDPNNYCLLSYIKYDLCDSIENNLSDLSSTYQNYSRKLPAKYYWLPRLFEEKSTGRLEKVKKYLANIINHIFIMRLLFQIPTRTKKILSIIKKEKCNVLIACTGGDFLDLPSGYFACRLAKIPFYAYIFDDYCYQWTKKKYRFFAHKLESIISKNDPHFIVPNEALYEEYRHRYNVKPVVIHNLCETPKNYVEDPWPSTKGLIRIVYTGAIYNAHYDAFENLIAATKLLLQHNVEIHVYTSDSIKLINNNISGSLIYHNHLPLPKALEVQRQSDILFLPLAFHSPIPEIIKTSAPGKMGEYLASSRPILVHAPAYSFISQYFKKNQCGMVVDKDDPDLLARAIESIIINNTLRRQLCENAYKLAKSDFALESVQAQFINLFKSY